MNPKQLRLNLLKLRQQRICRPGCKTSKRNSLLPRKQLSRNLRAQRLKNLKGWPPSKRSRLSPRMLRKPKREGFPVGCTIWIRKSRRNLQPRQAYLHGCAMRPVSGKKAR